MQAQSSVTRNGKKNECKICEPINYAVCLPFQDTRVYLEYHQIVCSSTDAGEEASRDTFKSSHKLAESDFVCEFRSYTIKKSVVCIIFDECGGGKNKHSVLHFMKRDERD